MYLSFDLKLRVVGLISNLIEGKSLLLFEEVEMSLNFEGARVLFFNENLDSTLMLNGSGKTRPIRVGSGWVPAGRVHFAIPTNFVGINHTAKYSNK